MSKKFRMHVTCGTHWDREWRHTAEQSKLRLTDLVDSIIELLERKPSYKTFCLDGGLIVVEDYLTVRPENEERLRRLIQAGRIQLVGWYTLPEMFTVAPEALIRNLLVGQRMARAIGGTMESGYTATSYGQTSQLPQLYRGFGISTAIFYRGTNRHVLPSLFLWEGADGTRLHTLRTFDEVTRTNWYFYVHQPLVLGKPPRDLSYTYDKANLPVHLCDEGLYLKAFSLLHEKEDFLRDEASLKNALALLTKQAMPYAVGSQVLAMNMEDNDKPFEKLPEMVDAMNSVSPDIEFVQSSLDEYMQAIIAGSPESKLHVHKGELRYPVVEGGFNGLLGATHSSRPRLKLLNENAETLLVHLAEPLASVASFYGAEYPRTILDRAWLALLSNQAHDSICGAAVDQAHEDMLYRFSIARTVAEEIVCRGVSALFRRLDTATGFQNTDHTITLFNTLNRPRKEVVALVIDLPRMGSGGGIVDPATGVGADSREIDYFDIVDRNGKAVPCHVLSKESIQMAVERDRDTAAAKFPAIRRRLLVEVEVPEMGWATYALRPRGPQYVKNPQPVADRPLLARENGVLENEFLRVQIAPNGTFSLRDKTSGREMAGLHYFTDSGEVGSAHRSVQPQRNTVQTSLGSAAAITLVESSLLRGVYRIDLTLTVPAAATNDTRDRLPQTMELPITTWLTLEKGAKSLKLRTKLTNAARDHKLRVLFPTGIRTDEAAVESAFSVERRGVRWTETGDNAEGFFAFQPMQNFVDLSDGKVGLAVLNRGMREYEVMDDADRTLAITLLRTHRAYMTPNADMTPEEFDRFTGLHAMGELECRYALMPHAGDWESGGVLWEAYRHKVDIQAIQGLPKPGELPAAMSFFTVSPAGAVMMAALKQSEDGQATVLRVWNTTGTEQTVSVTTRLPVKAARRVRLDETPMADLELRDGTFRLALRPHEIATVTLSA